MFTAIENNPININLLVQANYTGWSLPGDGTAVHVTCQAGLITNFSYPVTAGQSYQVSWVATVVSSGYVQLQTPGSNGAAQTAPGIFVETVTPTSNGFIQFYSNANCTIEGFTVSNVTPSTGITIVYSANNQKWSDFRTFYPDFGWSLFENTITAYNGQLYFHQNGTDNTNNFYGTQYQTIIEDVFAQNPITIKTYEVLSYQCNQLLTSTIDGITTSLGQVSTLIDTDFVKAALTDGVTSVTVYQNDNVYSASFWNDQADDVVNGSNLKGNWIAVRMTTVDGSTIMKLFSMSVKTARTFIGNR